MYVAQYKGGYFFTKVRFLKMSQESDVMSHDELDF